MDAWEKLALNAGLPGVMLVAFLYAIKLAVGLARELAVEWLKISERRVSMDERKTDAQVSAMTALGAEIRAHGIQDLHSHQEMASEVASLHGKFDAVLDRFDRTPVEGVPRISSEYAHGRQKTRP